MGSHRVSESQGVSDAAVQKTLEHAFDAVPDAMLMHRDGKVVKANAAACRLFRLQEPALRDKGLASLLRGDATGMLEALTTAEGTPPQELKVGEEGVPVLAWGIPHKGANRLGVLLLRDLSDNSEHARVGRQRAERDAELVRLEQVNRFKTQLLNTAAHELNTPLTPLRLQTHLLRSGNLGKLGERQLKAVQVLQRNVDRLSMLVEDILDVARMESGNLKIEKEACSLADMVQEAVEAYEETARGMSVGLRVDLDSAVVVDADPRRIAQVLYNLVSNALKFTPEGGNVVVRARDDRRGIVEVEDSGIGMDEDQMARLFEPFSRVHDTDAVTVAGTGLGLYISRGIIEAHGGHLAVESQGPGKGTTFRFDLPLADHGVEAEDASSGPRSPSPLVAGPLAQRLRELI